MDPQTRYWNEAGAGKTFSTPFPLDLFAAHVARDARILDVGCGYGRILAQLAAAGFSDLRGVDVAQGLVARGLAEHPDLRLTTYPGGPLPFPDQAFDAALLLGVLTCLLRDGDQAAILAELARVLRPGGHLVVVDFLLNRDRRNLDRYRRGLRAHGVYGVFDLEDGGSMRHHDRHHLRALFAGWERVAWTEEVFRTMHGHRSAGFSALLRRPG